MTAFRMFVIFSKVSAVTIGGGYAMIPVIRDFLVKRYRVLNDEEFMDMIIQAQAVPGVIAINAATIVGKRLAGLPGAVSAILGSIIPPFMIILLIAMFFTELVHLPLVAGFLRGARVGVTVVLANLAFQLLKKNARKALHIIVVSLGSIAIVWLNVSSLWVLLIASACIFAIDMRKRGTR